MTEEKKMPDQQALIDMAIGCGATKAAVIHRDQIVTSAAFRESCKSCWNYGKCWMCPPDAGEIEDLIARIDDFTWGLWYQTYGEIEDSFDYEGMMELGKLHKQTSVRLQAAAKETLGTGILCLSGGGCGACERCAKIDGLPCRAPDRAVASLSAYGVDVSRTTRTTELKYNNGQNTVTYFGVVLFNAE